MEVITLGDKKVRLDKAENTVCFYRRRALSNWELFAIFSIPPEYSDMRVYDMYLEDGHPTVILDGRSFYDVAVILNEETGQMLRWHFTK